MATPDYPTPLPRSTPEAQGLASSAVQALVDDFSAMDAIHSLMILRHGHVVAEGWWAPFRPDEPHMLFSLSKSFTATAAGFAVAEGRLSLDAPVVSFFPDDAPAEISEHLAALRVRHLLTMAVGYEACPSGPRFLRPNDDPNWVRTFLAHPIVNAPGSTFMYSSAATYLVSAIVQQVTGQTLMDYLQPRLLGPLGITGATWQSCPRGINVGGWGLSVRTEDIARFGLLYLNDGVWQGQRLLPEGWVAEATRRHIANGDDPNSDWAQGYGFQFWRSRHGNFRGDGAFGQFCVVMPSHDAVVAITSGVGDLQSVLNRLWDRLLPAFQPEPLPADSAAAGALCERLANLELPKPEGNPTSPCATQVDGKTFRLEPNEPGAQWLRLDLAGGRLIAGTPTGERAVPFAIGAWGRGISTWEGEPHYVAAAGAWTEPDTFAIRLWYTRTPFGPTIFCRFEGDTVKVTFRRNVSFGLPNEVELVGRPA